MKPYTFYLHDSGRKTPSFDFVHCRDDDEALLHAEALLERFPEYQLIEIYDGSRTRLTVNRDGVKREGRSAAGIAPGRSAPADAA